MDEYDDAKKAYVKELVDGHSRKEIDEMAKALDLDPEKYATKREVALGIMLATDQASMYKPEEKPTDVGEEYEEVDVTMSSVKSIRKAIQDKVPIFHDAIQVFSDDVKKQMKENRDFANEFALSIEPFRHSVLEQSKENQKFIKQFYG